MRIITGCSRSGTSFLCQLLDALGANFGGADELIRGDEWNTRGYFENKAVNTLNHRLLFGGWSDPKLWVDHMWPRKERLLRLRKLSALAMSPMVSRPRLIEKRGEEHRDEISAFTEPLHDRCVKDPRFCYLMQPWCAHGNVQSVLFALRHPAESSASMARMARIPLPLARMGWLDSIRRFWDSPPERPIHIVDYNAFFDPERAIDACRPLFKFLDIDFDEPYAQKALDQCLDPVLRTQTAPARALPRDIDSAYRDLLERANGS